MKGNHNWRLLIPLFNASRLAPSATTPAASRCMHSTTAAMYHEDGSSPSSASTHPSLDHIRAEKSRLRKLLKAQLAALTPTQLSTESHHATQLLLTHPVLSHLLAATSAVAVYLSMPTAEFQTRHLLSHLFAAGKRVFLPRVVSSERMLLLECQSMADVDSLPVNNWGIREPPATDGRLEVLQCAEQVGACVVPGVAFTKEGLRLGHGRGYYDRYLHAWDEERQRRGIAGRVPTVGLALRCQLVEQLPVTTHDRRIDHIIHAPMENESST